MKQQLLNRNEVMQGPSPQALRSLKKFKVSHANLYLEGYFSSLLILRLSKIFKVSEEQVLVGYGGEDIFRTIFDSLKPQTDTVLIHELHYTYHDEYLKFKNIRLENFKLLEKGHEFVFDIQDCIKKIKKFKPKVVIITSPNNPTGNSISPKDFSKIISSTGKNSLVVLDEAYFGFDNGYREKSFVLLLKKYKNLMILRSFSKLYALAGLRIGFALCGENVKNLFAYQNSYLGQSRILEEVAIAALNSKKYYRNLAQQIIAARQSFIQQVNKLRYFRAFNSKANFVLIKVDAKIKAVLKKALNKSNVLIAKFVSGELMRVSIVSRNHNKAFLKMLAKADKQL